MGEILFSGGAALGNNLQGLMMAQDIVPGDQPSYQLCKIIATYHPLGKKLSDSPIIMAQSQPRTIAIPKGPEDRLKEAFEAEWKKLRANEHIKNVGRLARVYGVATIALLTDGVKVTEPVDFDALWNATIGFNVYDPLNTAGSLVLNQDPLSIDFQKVIGIAVMGQRFNRSRSVTLLHEDPFYIEWTSSAFGYVGRSVYQRPLFPLKSFVQTMVTDDMVSLKAGVLIAKIKATSSIVNRTIAAMAALKRNIVKEAITNNVISIDPDEDIETLNMQNLDGAYGLARENIIENVATAADMPAIIINAETFAEGFGEGTEDAKYVAQYIESIRIWLQPVYDWFDKIAMYRAWNEEFYKTIQADFPEYKDVKYNTAFQDWKNSFTAVWPSLLEEPDSEKIKVDDVKLKAVIAWFQVLAPLLDPENRIILIQWACDTFNGLKLLFASPLVLDFDALEDFEPEQAMEDGDNSGEGGGGAKVKLGRADSNVLSLAEAKQMLTDAVGKLPDRAAVAQTRQAARRSRRERWMRLRG
jgi:hypothetical protein